MVFQSKVKPLNLESDVVKQQFMSYKRHLENCIRAINRQVLEVGRIKYAALGGIVDECCSALTDPISDLQDCIQNLQALLHAVQAYEETSL